ncbi:hypothetical protein UlMin_007599 [Ulmus minor]
MGSSKRGADNSRSISEHTHTLHQRLQQALNLGTRSHEKNSRKWQCTDIQIQKHVIRSISSFLDSVSGDELQNPLVKDSVADMVEALVWILQSKNEAMSSMVANVTVKLVSILPYSVLQSYVLDLVSPLSSLLSSHQTEVAMSCVTALHRVLSNLSIKNEKAVWEILKETKTVHRAINCIHSSYGGSKPIEYVQHIASLLSVVLERWPPSRFPVWSDAKLMKTFNEIFINPDFYNKEEILKLLSALALCHDGAMKLLENGKAFLEMMVQCMDKSQRHSVRMEAFKLAQYLAMTEQGFCRMISLSCEPIVEAIICGMSKRSMNSRKAFNEQNSVLLEACRMALITSWGGKHHICFWKQGIDSVLLDLLLENSHKKLQEPFLSLEEQISIAQEGLNSTHLLALRKYIWDILGWLAIHCEEGFNPGIHGNELYIDMLITSACLAFVDAVQKRHRHCRNDVADALRSVSATRAVLMMIYSPCNYIASKARYRLSEILRPNGVEIIKHLLNSLQYISSRTHYDILPLVIYVMGLTCYTGLPLYRRWIVEGVGVKILLAFVSWCFGNAVHVESLSFSSHMHNAIRERTCCYVSTDVWEGKNIIMLYSLWGLLELIKHWECIRNDLGISSGAMTFCGPELFGKLKEICVNTSSPGLRWFAAYTLTSTGFYGFPSKLGNRIGKALNEKDHTDTKLVLANGEIFVHGVILAIRCPSLLPLPLEDIHLNEKNSDSSGPSSGAMCNEFQKDIRLSAYVDHQALMKLLEYVYLGYVQIEEDFVKKLKILAKSCNLQPLLQMLSRKIPKWGTPFPSSDFSPALGPLGHRFSDVIWEASTTELPCWTCNFCSVSVPHMHVHKVILSASCDYLRAMFNSGMQESHSQTIKVPISWEALVKLVAWFYSDELPSPPSGCLWENMGTEEKLNELKPYIELCWLAEFWMLEDVKDTCLDVIFSHLEPARQLLIKIIQIALDFSQWNLAEVAATHVAPFYCQLRDSGELEDLDEALVDMVRAASVRHSQEGVYRSR